MRALSALAVAAVGRKPSAAPGASLMDSARRHLPDESSFSAFRAELKPLLLRLKAVRRLETACAARLETHAVLDAVHALLLRLTLGGLHEEFSAYVPAGAREYWRALHTRADDGPASDATPGCLEQPASACARGRQLAYEA